MKFPIIEHTILLTIAGSRSYGMHKSDSDIDLKGIAIPPIDSYIGVLPNFEQVESSEAMMVYYPLLSNDEKDISDKYKLEGVIYDLRKFIRLASGSNPNILDVLFCDDEHVRFSSKAGDIIRASRDLFISAQAKHTYSGYATAQFKRIKTHRGYLLNAPKTEPDRSEFGLSKDHCIPRAQVEASLSEINKKLDEWELDLSSIDSESDRMSILNNIAQVLSEIMSTTDSKWKSSARNIGYGDNLIEILDKERRFRQAKNEWDKYQYWKKGRNSARAKLEEKYGYDTKHASHLVRLMRMCYEILVDGKVNVNRKKIDADELVAIRDGSWSYDKLEEFFITMDNKCSELYNSKSYSIPHRVDMSAINALCVQLISDKYKM
jgi:predicted nucleotidyltransferase